ncbi:MAG: hypothetical protein ACYTG5_06395 [Planctomycetota bacterium]|jgi:hypothetical protein
MRRAILLLIGLSLLGQRTAEAQETTYVHVDLRVSTAGGTPGTVIVDRGKSDRVEIGDTVIFFEQGTEFSRGNVTQVDDRSAVVEIRDRSLVPRVGARGQVLIPSSRNPQRTQRLRQPTPKPDPQPPQTQDPQELPPEHPGWRNKDEEYQEGMALLALVKPIRPEEREMEVSGHIYSTGSFAQTKGDGSHNSYFRGGANVDVLNPFGYGGGVNIDAEFDYRREVNDNTGVDLYAKRLSYWQGGTRFERTRWEFGRFLQYGMPEFGLLDGVEWGRRLDNADRIGASIGFMPELDDDLDSGDDFQFAAYYMWAADDRERLTATIGYQKTLHNGDTDRDLVVGKIRVLPTDGWDFHGSIWVDIYTGSDNLKDSALEVTMAVASLARRWDGAGIDLTYRHSQFPDINRNNEFIYPGDAGIEDFRYDRLTFSGWQLWGKDTRVHTLLSGWDDERETGGSAELGWDFQELLADRSHTDFTAFGDLAKFSKVVGIRLNHGQFLDNGRWDFLYEISGHNFDHFPADANDLIQHRIRASRTLRLREDWLFTLHGDLFIFDDDASWAVGFDMNKSF